MAQHREWVRLMVVPGLAEAEMWQTLLVEEGIAALIQPNDASAYLGPQSFCHVLVPASDIVRARELTTAWSAESPAESVPAPAE